ncbi:MAG TPA: RNA methyltransferase [Rhodocyclaceae bacterium]|nr:MAG: RNA methyltransferase [Betaproteobacteria bacterium CG2_30_68_42]PJA56320.1 MAG: RNA methyltransferase [Rhodocyclales bacterium CG_4_9_14_3_um_filter_68_10]HCX33881.1 RNA methyltransferase [Rhodocyclaceae bacterium]
MSASERFFATCPRNLEALLAAELASAGAQAIEQTAGGVGFDGSRECCYRANLASRIATRILWRVARGHYRSERDLYRLATGQPWPEWFGVERSLRVSVSAIRAPVRSLDYVTLLTKDAVCDRFRRDTGTRPDIDTRDPEVRVHVFLEANDASLYLDISGAPLYKRGFRTARVDAPIKENLAAGILMLTGWRPGKETLLDAMCGSGTFLIEAAQMALGIAPGLGRGFAFERLCGFEPALWQRIVGEARARCRPPAPLAIHGSDRDARALAAARENLRAAGLEEAVELRKADILDREPPAPSGVLIANPPYGVRLAADTAALDALYPRLGDALKQRFAGWRCYFLSPDPQLPKRIGLRSSKRTVLFNGPIECRLLEYRIVAGALKAAPREPLTRCPDPGARR